MNFKIPKLPAPLATFLLRIPLSVMFLQQGLDKFPVNEETADAVVCLILFGGLLLLGKLVQQ